MSLPGKRVQKERAQEMLMQGIAKVLGYWSEENPNPFATSSQDESGNWRMAEPLTEEEQEAFKQVLLREADRVAKLFGFDSAWTA